MPRVVPALLFPLLLLSLLGGRATDENDWSSPLQEAISAVRSILRQSSLPTRARIEALEQVRSEHAQRLEPAYVEAFRTMGSRGEDHELPASTATWYKGDRVVLHPKRNGVAAVSAIVNDRRRLVMCTVPKIDSSTWRKVMLYLEHPELYNTSTTVNRPPDQHNIKKNGVKIMAQQTPAAANAYYNDPRYLKLFHCRNPTIRVLSAWISKNANSLNPIPFAADYATFSGFIMHLQNDAINLSTADAHIRHQHSYCDVDRGAHYDVFLKMESRRYWIGEVLRAMNLTNDLFVAPLLLKQTKPKADRLEVFLRHYSPRLFGIVKDLYQKDISLFGYDEEVQLLEEILKHKKGLISSPGDAERIL